MPLIIPAIRPVEMCIRDSGYTLPVKEVLRKGENHLQILFHSPVKQTLPQGETNGFDYPADNDHSDKRVSIYSRKDVYKRQLLFRTGVWIACLLYVSVIPFMGRCRVYGRAQLGSVSYTHLMQQLKRSRGET